MPSNSLRKSLRLEGYDYALPGAYFVTLVTHNRENLFGEVIEGNMMLNSYGNIVAYHWSRLRRLPYVGLGDFVIMPNHLHGFVNIVESKYTGLSEIIRRFKSFSARDINHLRGLPRTSVWQRSYYDRIIRNEPDLRKITDYILVNPQNWEEDQLNKR